LRDDATDADGDADADANAEADADSFQFVAFRFIYHLSLEIEIAFRFNTTTHNLVVVFHLEDSSAISFPSLLFPFYCALFFVCLFFFIYLLCTFCALVPLGPSPQVIIVNN